jgi:hypothetical protein
MTDEESSLVRRASELLSAVAPGQPVKIVPGRLVGRSATRDVVVPERARLELIGARTVKYARLEPDTDRGLALHLNPGDTLTQARHLYREPARVDGLLNLRARGWDVRPNFHFGFIERGYTWTTTPLDVDSYTAYWIDRIEDLGAFQRDDWDQEFHRLISDGIFDPRDESTFDRDFRQTERRQATPRPSLVARRSWPLTRPLDGSFVDELRDSLRMVLLALREPLTTIDLEK